MPRSTPDESDAIARRQERVWHLHVVRKLTEHEIGQIMNISRSTVARDLATMRRRGYTAVARSAASEKAVIEAGLQTASELDAVVRQAWTDCLAAPEGSLARVGYLNLILKATAERLRILQSLGLMKKAPEELLLGDLDLRQLSDAELQTALNFLRSLPQATAADEPAAATGADNETSESAGDAS
jgi:predicted DNA-binding protein (UPF0251 family)